MLYKRINLFGHPVLWVKHNYLNGLEYGFLTFAAFGPAVIVIIGFIADLISISDVMKDNITILLASMLFVYGLINMVLIVGGNDLSRILKNEKSYYKVMHKNIVEYLRDYRVKRDNSDNLDETYFIAALREILEAFNNNYMKKRYSLGVIGTIKYKKNNKLYPIRVGDNADYRASDPEGADESYVYKALNDFGSKLPYIYVKDINNPDECEAKAMGKLSEKIKGRAADNYKTFIAFPIRGGKIPFPKGAEMDARQDLGVLGFDLKKAYEFGNFEEKELDYIACLVDSLAEIILDLIKSPAPGI